MGLGDLAGAKKQSLHLACVGSSSSLLTWSAFIFRVSFLFRVLCFGVFTSLFQGPQQSSSLLWQFLVFPPFLFSFIPSSFNSTPSAMTPDSFCFYLCLLGISPSFLPFYLFVSSSIWISFWRLWTSRLNGGKGSRGRKHNKDFPEEKFAGRYFKTTISIAPISPLTLDFKDQICVFHHLP